MKGSWKWLLVIAFFIVAILCGVESVHASKHRQCIQSVEAWAKQKVQKSEKGRVGCRWSCLGWSVLGPWAGGACLLGCEGGFSASKSHITRQSKLKKEACARYLEINLPYRNKVRHLLPENKLIAAIGQARLDGARLSFLVGRMHYEETKVKAELTLTFGDKGSAKSEMSSQLVRASYIYAVSTTLSPKKATYFLLGGERFRLTSVEVGKGFSLHIRISGKKAKAAGDGKISITKVAAQADASHIKASVYSQLVVANPGRFVGKFPSIPDFSISALTQYYKAFGTLQKDLFAKKGANQILAVTLIRE